MWNWENQILKWQFEKRIYKNKFVSPTKGGTSFVVLFREEKTGFTILKFIENKTEKIYSVKGNFDEIPDWLIELHWNFDSHAIHWDSFNVQNYFNLLPEKKEETIEYLYKFLWITEGQASKMWTKYWQDIFEKLDNDIDILDDLKDSLFKGWEDWKNERLNKVKDKWKEESSLRQIRKFLYQYWISEAYSKRIIKQYWTKAISEIKKNPYCLTQISGIWFLMADKLAMNMGIPKDSPSRVYSSIIYSLEKIADETGSTYTEFLVLQEHVLKILWLENLEGNTLLNYLNNLEITSYDQTLDQQIYPKLKIINHKEKIFIFLYKHYKWEEDIAKFLEINNKPIDFDIPSDEELNEIAKELYQSQWKKVYTLNEKQLEAIKIALWNKISIITGYAWTGKTTIIKVLLEIFKRNSISYILLWPTWKSVDVLWSVTNESSKCSTIHRKIKLLEWDIWSEEISESVSITDEYSMVDLRLANAQFSATTLMQQDQSRLIFSWDKEQLRPVWIWNPFHDMIESKRFPVVFLTEIYRQSENSSILLNCKNLIEWKDLNLENTDDWKTVSCLNKSAEEVQKDVINEIKEKWWENTDIVLTSKKSSALWTYDLNKQIQSLIFSQKNSFSLYKYEKGLNSFYLWDRVVQTENWYREKDKEIFSIVPYDLLINPDLLTKFKSFCRDKKIHYDWLYIENGILQNNDLIFWKFIYNKDGKIQDIEFDIKEKTEKTEFDINVYNWNWWQVVWIRQDDWTWMLKGYENEVQIRKEVFSKTELMWFWKKDINKKILLSDYWLSEKHILLVSYKGKVIWYTKFEIGELDLFYASTVHKCQWSQFRKVYAINTSHINYFCDKTWLYTQLSRAESFVTYFSSQFETKKVQDKLFSRNVKGTLFSRLKNMKTQDE